MALSQMQVFNEYVMPATIETLSQMVKKFNAASGGAISLTTEGFTGDFLQESFFAGLSGAQRRVDRYAANASVTPVDLTQGKQNSVKIAGAYGPVRFEPSQLTWLQKPTAEGVEVISRTMADYLMSDQLNTSILALVAAISAQSAATNDVSSTLPITYDAMNNSHALFGDSSGQLITQVMTGMQFHKLIGQNLANTSKLFVANNVQVVDVFGKLVVITDAPALTAFSKQRVLSLASNAAIVSDGGDLIGNVQTVNGLTRIETTLQADYTFGLGLKGYSWNDATGGKSPTDAKLATGANWTKIATSIKQTAGVLTIGQP